jgi:hypothetical protein
LTHRFFAGAHFDFSERAAHFFVQQLCLFGPASTFEYRQVSFLAGRTTVDFRASGERERT